MKQFNFNSKKLLMTEKAMSSDHETQKTINRIIHEILLKPKEKQGDDSLNSFTTFPPSHSMVVRKYRWCLSCLFIFELAIILLE